MTDSIPLEPTSIERLGLGAQALEFLDSFVESLDAGPASFPPADRALLDRMREPPPELGVTLDELLDKIDTAANTGFDTAAGSHLSYIPNGGLYTAALGSLLGAGLNRWTGGSHGAPGSIAIEQGVVDWMLGLFGLGEGSTGVLLSGGSLANFAAVVAARSRFGEDFSTGTIYVSDRAHHSIAKAARLAGIATKRVRVVPTDRAFRIDPELLERAIKADTAAGLQPMAVVGTAGTTDTGTIDPLAELAAIAATHSAWFHIDAAYGGFFQMTERGAERLGGIESADSITLDAHKSLFMPFGVGCLLVRDRAALIESNEGIGTYMQDAPRGAAVPDFFELGPELTRPFRGLPVWLALHLHGVAAFRNELDRMLDLAERAQRELETIDGIETMPKPDLSVVAFRSSTGDEGSSRLHDRLNASRKVHVSSTTIDGRFTLRLAFLNFRTTDSHLDTALGLIREACEA